VDPDSDPDPYWIRIQLGLWIRIRIRDPVKKFVRGHDVLGPFVTLPLSFSV